jgi:hypothetical protein
MANKLQKVTYTAERRNILLLKVAFKKGDFSSFQRLLSELPKNYSITIISDDKGAEELFVNVPAENKEKGFFG